MNTQYTIRQADEDSLQAFVEDMAVFADDFDFEGETDYWFPTMLSTPEVVVTAEVAAHAEFALIVERYNLEAV